MSEPIEKGSDFLPDQLHDRCGEASADAEVFAGLDAASSLAEWGDDFCEDGDEEEDDEFDCGAWFNGKFDFYSCQLAGTEDCDWECPYSAGARGLKS